MTFGFLLCSCRNPNWWRRRTKLERSLLIISGILFVLAAAGFGLWASDFLKAKEDKETPQATALHGDSTTINKVPIGRPPKDKTGAAAEDVCLTQECIHTASTVLRKMKPEVEPCDNFYEFACGTYLEEENIPDDKVSISTFSVISDKLQEQLKDIITAERPETEPKHFRLPNLLYKACMNKSKYFYLNY